MGTIKTNGIILLESNMGDYDKMLTMLTPGLGKIGCAAKGARRSKSLLLAGTQFLCFGEYVLFETNNSYRINSCESIEVFYPIRTDLDKLEIASKITKIVCDVTNEGENSFLVLQLLLNTLYVISQTNLNHEFVLSIFKLRLACILGFMPHIKNCKTCKKSEDLIYFSMKENGFKCGICGKQDTSIIHISQPTVDAIRYLSLCPAKKLYSFQIPENCIRELKIVSKLYLNDKLEKQYD